MFAGALEAPYSTQQAKPFLKHGERIGPFDERDDGLSLSRKPVGRNRMRFDGLRVGLEKQLSDEGSGSTCNRQSQSRTKSQSREQVAA
ncbi:hypothetical protein YTPLAS18_20670 [Nitrospira sp.]|nr:hypothetical protein YTPLAS18_20670 [Nitrospira sp.]